MQRVRLRSASGTFRPVARPTPDVYRRRRLAAGAVVVVLVLVVVAAAGVPMPRAPSSAACGAP